MTPNIKVQSRLSNKKKRLQIYTDACEEEGKKNG